MARDYKRTRKPAKKKTASSPWMFLASGFALGLIAALAMYLHLRPAELEVPDRPVPSAATNPQSSNDSENEPAETGAPVSSAPEPPENRRPATVDSEYGFYEELPNFEVVVADENNQPVVAKSTAARPQRPVETPGEPANYLLQAGSFRKFVDADRRKAELAFKGIESDIQPVILKDKGTWYRVYVGPSTDFGVLENMRSDLRRANIDVIIYKVR